MSKRTLIAVFMLIALALRSLVPDGFMIAAANEADGPFEIIICTSSGHKLLQVAADDDQAPADSKQDGQTLCHFAFSGASGLAAAAPDIASTVAYANLTFKLAAALYAKTPTPGAVSARGPPPLLI